MTTIHVQIAGQDRIDDVSVDEGTTAQDVLNAVNCPDFELSPGVGLPPYGKDELLIDRVKPFAKIVASPRADAGSLSTPVR